MSGETLIYILDPLLYTLCFILPPSSSSLLLCMWNRKWYVGQSTYDGMCTGSRGWTHTHTHKQLPVLDSGCWRASRRTLRIYFSEQLKHVEQDYCKNSKHAEPPCLPDFLHVFLFGRSARMIHKHVSITCS